MVEAPQPSGATAVAMTPKTSDGDKKPPVLDGPAVLREVSRLLAAEPAKTQGPAAAGGFDK